MKSALVLGVRAAAAAWFFAAFAAGRIALADKGETVVFIEGDPLNPALARVPVFAGFCRAPHPPLAGGDG